MSTNNLFKRSKETSVAPRTSTQKRDLAMLHMNLDQLKVSTEVNLENQADRCQETLKTLTTIS